MQQKTSSHFDLCIVGAGISGLSTADKFLQKFPQLKIIVIEARDRVGGRTFAESVDGYNWDLGGQWLGPKQHRMYSLCKRFNLELFEQYYKGKVVSVPLDNNEQIEIYGDDDQLSSVYPQYVNRYMSDLETCMEQVQISEEKRREYDSMSVFEWKKKMYGQEIAEKLNTVQGLVSMDPKNVSFLYWLMYLIYGQGLVFLSETHEGGQHERIKGGSYLFSQKLYLELSQKKNCSFVFNHEVQCIEQLQNTVQVITNKGLIVDASRCVLSIPPMLVANIHFNPALPRRKQILYDNFPMGHVIKAIVFYDRPWWREQGGYSGISITNNSKYGVRLSYDCSLEFPEHTQYGLVAFFLGNGQIDWTNATLEDRKKHACECFGYFFNNKEEAMKATNYIEKDWNKDKYAGGAYVGHLPPKVLTTIGGMHVLRENVDLVHFCGTETATEFLGYMEGAVQSAERVLEELIPVYETRILQSRL
jgi:monoamine oxidase